MSTRLFISKRQRRKLPLIHNRQDSELEGPEGVKWELEFTYYLDWENGIWVTGTGNIDTELGMRKPVYYYKGSRANFDREFV